MLEYEWFHGIDYDGMISAIETTATPRKLGLAACAYIRWGWAEFNEPRLQGAIEVADAYADFRAAKEELKAAKRSLALLIEEDRAERLRNKAALPERAWDLDFDGGVEPNWSLEKQVRLIECILKPSRVNVETLAQVARTSTPSSSHDDRQRTCALLREVFGNPFQPVAFAPEWRTGTTTAIAREMYDSRDFGAMPILADALQEAGCDNEDVLAHCRDASGLHVRGCWVVDLVLGKE